MNVLMLSSGSESGRGGGLVSKNFKLNANKMCGVQLLKLKVIFQKQFCYLAKRQRNSLRVSRTDYGSSYLKCFAQHVFAFLTPEQVDDHLFTIQPPQSSEVPVNTYTLL